MHTWTRNRWVSTLVAAGYVLAISAASLFHNHAEHDGGTCCHGQLPAHETSADCHHDESDHDAPPPQAPSQCPANDSHCSVCQFLSQKPAPTAEVAPASTGLLVQEVFLSAPARIAVDVFSAWHSRGPPAFA